MLTTNPGVLRDMRKWFSFLENWGKLALMKENVLATWFQPQNNQASYVHAFCAINSKLSLLKLCGS